MDFFGKHRRPKLDEGKMDSMSKVETAGYIPADKQIESFIVAGRRLAEARKEMYDFGPDEEVPPDFIDPTRSGSFDLADASQLGRATAKTLQDKASKKRVEDKAEPAKDGPPKEERKEE